MIGTQFYCHHIVKLFLPINEQILKVSMIYCLNGIFPRKQLKLEKFKQIYVVACSNKI